MDQPPPEPIWNAANVTKYLTMLGAQKQRSLFSGKSKVVPAGRSRGELTDHASTCGTSPDEFVAIRASMQCSRWQPFPDQPTAPEPAVHTIPLICCRESDRLQPPSQPSLPGTPTRMACIAEGGPVPAAARHHPVCRVWQRMRQGAVQSSPSVQT